MSTCKSVPPREFSVRLYESGATAQGCSAFQAGQIATLDFGNPGQFDAGEPFGELLGGFCR